MGRQGVRLIFARTKSAELGVTITHDLRSRRRVSVVVTLSLNHPHLDPHHNRRHTFRIGPPIITASYWTVCGERCGDRRSTQRPGDHPSSTDVAGGSVSHLAPPTGRLRCLLLMSPPVIQGKGGALETSVHAMTRQPQVIFKYLRSGSNGTTPNSPLTISYDYGIFKSASA